MRIYLSNEKQATSKIDGTMHRIVKIALFVLLVACIFSYSAKAQDFRVDNIRAIASSLSTDLADPFDKLKLANDIRRYFDWRVKVGRFGYEREEQFQREFKAAFEVFIKTLYSKDLNGAENRLNNNLLRAMEKAYKKNERDFHEFYYKIQSISRYYSKKPPHIMIRQIAQFAIVLNESGTDSLNTLMRITGIWPFC